VQVHVDSAEVGDEGAFEVRGTGAGGRHCCAVGCSGLLLVAVVAVLEGRSALSKVSDLRWEFCAFPVTVVRLLARLFVGSSCCESL
jgi:hypothetical protein